MRLTGSTQSQYKLRRGPASLVITPLGSIEATGGDLSTNRALVSSTPTGPPIKVTSTALVSNLNADLLDGKHAGTSAGNVLVLGEDGKVPSDNLPASSSSSTTSSASVTLQTTGSGNIVDFMVGSTPVAYVTSEGRFLGLTSSGIITVGPHDSSNLANAQVKLDGVNDSAIINGLIEDLNPTNDMGLGGGELVFLDGFIVVTTPILLRHNVVITGCGSGTTFFSDADIAIFSQYNTTASLSRVILRDFRVDGNLYNDSDIQTVGIHIANIGGIIQNVECLNLYIGIKLRVALAYGDIDRCYIHHNSFKGVELNAWSSLTNSEISYIGLTAAGEWVWETVGVLLGNEARVINNVFRYNRINIQGSANKNVTIEGNILAMSWKENVFLTWGATGCVIANNRFGGVNPVEGQTDTIAIKLDGDASMGFHNNQIINNSFSLNLATDDVFTTCIVEDANSDYNQITGNLFNSGYSSAAIVKVGTHTVVDYVHPAAHSPSIITQDASNRFITDAERAAWNSAALGSAQLDFNTVTKEIELWVNQS